MKPTDDRLIILATTDTVAVARCFIKPGTTLDVFGQPVTVQQAFPMGHKIAIRGISVGDKVLKYGVSIGSATQAIAIGDHVHLHNMKSDYTPTYAITEDGEVA